MWVNSSTSSQVSILIFISLVINLFRVPGFEDISPMLLISKVMLLHPRIKLS